MNAGPKTDPKIGREIDREIELHPASCGPRRIPTLPSPQSGEGDLKEGQT